MSESGEPLARSTRREVIRKGAIVLGAAWTVPLIQTIPAHAQEVGSAQPCLPLHNTCANDAECCSGACNPPAGAFGGCCNPRGSPCNFNDPGACCSFTCVGQPVGGPLCA